MATFSPGWFNSQFGDHVHAHPIRDRMEHILTGEKCWCDPCIADNGVIVHNAADGREAWEEGRRKLS